MISEKTLAEKMIAGEDDFGDDNLDSNSGEGLIDEGSYKFFLTTKLLS